MLSKFSSLKKTTMPAKQKIHLLNCFRIFNTNNLWVRMAAIKRLLDAKEMHMEVIVNNKASFTLVNYHLVWHHRPTLLDATCWLRLNTVLDDVG